MSEKHTSGMAFISRIKNIEAKTRSDMTIFAGACSESDLAQTMATRELTAIRQLLTQMALMAAIEMDEDESP